MSDKTHPDDKLAKEARSLLEGHVKYFSSYDDHLDASLAKYVGGPKEVKTVGDLIKDGTMGKVMNDLLEKYLGIVGIKGEMAKEYLRELTLSSEELREMFKGQLDKKYNLQVANQLRNQVKSKLHNKLRDTIDNKIQNMTDVDKIKDFVEWFHKEAGTDYAFPGLREDIKTPVDGLGMYRRAFDTYVNKLDEKATYKKSDKKK
jgi:hypothetical protein